QANAFREEALMWAGKETPPADSTRAAESDLPDARPTIVWADDNADMRDYVARILGERYRVLAVANGAEALAIAAVETPDLVLTDVMMPGIDGFGVLRGIRHDPRTQHVPVLLLSARAGGESAIEGLQAGADDYVVKPFAAREL